MCSGVAGHEGVEAAAGRRGCPRDCPRGSHLKNDKLEGGHDCNLGVAAKYIELKSF